MMTTEHCVSGAPGRRSGASVYTQIADTLGKEIRDRAFHVTGKLPSEIELSTRFGVNRHTLRQAVGALQAQGLVRVEPGRGMFVQHERLDYVLSRRTRFSENLQRQGLMPSTQLLTACEIPAPERAALALKLAHGAPVLMVEMLDEANDQPIGLATAYYPAARFTGLLGLLGGGARVSEILRHFGVEDYVRAGSHISTQMPSEEVARLLKQPASRPLLCVESVDHDMQGVPIKYGETVFCGDRVQLVVEGQVE